MVKGQHLPDVGAGIAAHLALHAVRGEHKGLAISVIGTSRHFAAAQQPGRFRSKADFEFDASRQRVYEYTV